MLRKRNNIPATLWYGVIDDIVSDFPLRRLILREPIHETVANKKNLFPKVEGLEFIYRVTHGVVENGWVWLGEEGSSTKEGVNTRARGFWMEGNSDVLEYGSYMKKFLWGEIEPFHCGMGEASGVWCSTKSESSQSFASY